MSLEVTADLYSPLYHRALEIARRSSSYPPAAVTEIAHDITVDFLYFSRSYSTTFDPTKDLLPFFASYVRRKLRRVRDAESNYQNRISKDERAMRNLPVKDESFEWLEVKSRLEFFYDYLHSWNWKTVNLGRLFLITVQLRLIEGKETYRELSKRLNGARFGEIKEAQAEMRRLISEKIAEGY